ncbi:putative protein FAM172B [Rhineura floridana]|uniref:putative protein FAM172B n=1 Tax=Rhineura floridana TaxID=261503 RepID=UPI002AC833D2|nr:putative protein FAM172B [Rhineura floridana]XP_061484160.1 putative protein FAM172B [Rhineura floridana]XP_061484161.1 putative protein FAM172B [Rhineura floridana]XP_061484162.1 putative protein FAM172B [Rhineura floridana]XP_061484163.1 putative protein FAM172B [Rhineura floridana]XP_061484165.1 putative protein FAM172B [Rhineura floridana]XP_061484166.1 putative protein FAM172B [Rhineura floridana]XP_061484167.1 putative protein FAM172B [Rhineura floridana]XP_061484168.1 putative pro
MNWFQMNEDLTFRKLITGSECPERLKYDFNRNGELRHIDTNEPFVFNYQNSYDGNHKRYQLLGHLITQYVYELLENACKLQKIYIPTDAPDNELRSFFFMSENALTNCSTLVVLLQDKGTFRAGQWGQKTIIHEGLQHGSQIPFIIMARKCSWGVIVLNPNDNFIDLKIEQEHLSLSEKEDSTCPLQLPWIVPKRDSSSPEEHTTYVWDHFISKTTAGNIAFIAHGYGGLVFINLLMQRTLEVMNKVYAVAFIDSTHHTLHQTQGSSQMQAWIWKHCREWVSNSKPLDKSLGFLVKVDCPTVSTGIEKYSLAPSSSLQSIFRYLKNALKVSTKQCLTRSPIATRSKKK